MRRCLSSKLCKIKARDEKQNRKETGKCVATRHRQVYKAPNPPKWTTCARGAGTHGDVLDVDTGKRLSWMDTRAQGGRGGGGGHRQFCLPKSARVRLSRAPEVGSTKKPMDLSPFLESWRINRTRHVPDSSNHSLSLMKLSSSRTSKKKLRREPPVTWFGLSLAPKPKHNERFARQYRREPRALTIFQVLLFPLTQTTFKITEYAQTQAHIHTCTHAHNVKCNSIFGHDLSQRECVGSVIKCARQV